MLIFTVIQGLAKRGKVDAIICFGLLIKGETAHFEYISNAASQGKLRFFKNNNSKKKYIYLQITSQTETIMENASLHFFKA